jgi:hypothetical protein
MDTLFHGNSAAKDEGHSSMSMPTENCSELPSYSEATDWSRCCSAAVACSFASGNRSSYQLATRLSPCSFWPSSSLSAASLAEASAIFCSGCSGALARSGLLSCPGQPESAAGPLQLLPLD